MLNVKHSGKGKGGELPRNECDQYGRGMRDEK
jgi:hypothetical protein